MNRTKDAVAMLERCLMLNNGYTAAYLLLAKLHTGSQTGRLLKHVAAYQPKHPEHQARYARWLRDNREYSIPFYMRISYSIVQYIFYRLIKYI